MSVYFSSAPFALRTTDFSVVFPFQCVFTGSLMFYSAFSDSSQLCCGIFAVESSLRIHVCSFLEVELFPVYRFFFFVFRYFSPVNELAFAVIFPGVLDAIRVGFGRCVVETVLFLHVEAGSLPCPSLPCPIFFSCESSRSSFWPGVSGYKAFHLLDGSIFLLLATVTLLFLFEVFCLGLAR